MLSLLCQHSFGRFTVDRYLTRGGKTQCGFFLCTPEEKRGNPYCMFLTESVSCLDPRCAAFVQVLAEFCAQDEDGQTPLLFAARSGSGAVFRQALEALLARASPQKVFIYYNPMTRDVTEEGVQRQRRTLFVAKYVLAGAKPSQSSMGRWVGCRCVPPAISASPIPSSTQNGGSVFLDSCDKT